MPLLRVFSAFPGGLPGVGLLLLRLAIGIITVIRGVLYLTSPGLTLKVGILGALAFASGVMLVLGFLTPAVGTLIVLGGIGLALSWLPKSDCDSFGLTLSAVFSLVVSAAIVLLGPGAFSVDARLFGRREIVIPRVPSGPR